MADPKTSARAQFDALPIPGKIFMLVLMLGLLSAGYYFSLHMSLADEIQSAKQQYTQLEVKMKEAQAKQKEFLVLSQELAQREPIDRQNKRILPEAAEIPAFLQDLNRVAELSGLNMELVEPRPEEPQQMYVRIPVNLKVSGRYHQVAKFFYNVSRLDRAINMENIQLVDPKLTGEEVTLSIQALATTFRRPTEPKGGL